MSYLLAIDQGTTGSTVMIFNRAGQPVARGYREFRQYYPKPGWVEHDPLEILAATEEACREALQNASVAARRLTAIGITNQRETTVLWDRKTGVPVHRAIVWQCRRTAPMCRRLAQQGHAAKIARRTGLPLDAYFSATKLRWLLDHVPGARARAKKGDLCFGTVDSWLLRHLTREETHATDYTNASRTMLFNIDKRRWDPELCELFGVPEAVLPAALPSRAPFGTIKRFGDLPEGLPIAGVAGDQQAALVGQAIFDAGGAKNTYGTGCFLLVHTGQKRPTSKTGLLTTLAVGRGGKPAYALEGSVFIAGAAVQWLRDELGLIGCAEESDTLASSVPDSAGVSFVPAFVGLGAPHWDMDARGAFLGLTRGASKAHLVRAVLEGVALSAHDVLAAAERDTGKKLRVLRVDGGACANRFLMQFQADLLGTRIQRPRCLDTTALGAAYLAGLETGVFEDEREIERLWSCQDEFRPAMKPAQRRDHLARWQAALTRVRG